VLDHAAPLGPASLARAVYAGRPGHPVVIGADHLPALHEQLAGDTGANAYLAARGAAAVECGDLATGRDVDRR
jgi:CTP:molybdopterin cytidylyltransferase MocA